jgi:hypothetical protein
MFDANGWNFGPSELPTSQYPTVTCYYLAVLIDQDRDVKAERLNAARDLADLSFAVKSRIVRIELKTLNRAICDCHLRQGHGQLQTKYPRSPSWKAETGELPALRTAYAPHYERA